jgi:hypothetical protein
MGRKLLKGISDKGWPTYWKFCPCFGLPINL